MVILEMWLIRMSEVPLHLAHPQSGWGVEFDPQEVLGRS